MTETSKRAREEEEQEVQAANKKAAVQEEEKDNEDVDDVDSDGDDSDIGPMLPPADADVSTLTTARRKKPVRGNNKDIAFFQRLCSILSKYTFSSPCFLKCSNTKRLSSLTSQRPTCMNAL